MHVLAKVSVRFLIFLPVVFLLGVVLLYSEPLFFADDFHLLKTVVWLQDSGTFAQKFEKLIQQHNEHRILIPRLVTWFDYQLEGRINWRSLTVFGNLIWCGVLYFLWAAFRTLNRSVGYFLPVPWLLFHPIYFDNLTWTISVLQQSVIVFLLSWLVYAFAKRQFILAVFILLIATFTHGNGIFGVAIGAVFLVLYREWRWLILWLFIAVCIAVVYFYGFTKGQSANFSQSLANPLRLAAYFLAFLGSVTQVFFASSWLSVAWGALLLGGICGFGLPKIYALYSSGRPLSDFDKMLLGNLLFMGITSLLVAVSRSWMADDLEIPSRYAHYSPYLTAWFYLVGLAVLPRPVVSFWAKAWGVAAILLCTVSYLNYLTMLEYRRDWLRADGANWHNYSVFFQYAPSFNHNIRPEYLDALRQGICTNLSDLPTQFSEQEIDSTLRLTFQELVQTTPDASGEHPNPVLNVAYRSSRNQGVAPFLVLLSDNGKPVWIPFYRSRNAYKKIIKGLGLRKDEMSAEVLLENLPKGTFKVGVYSGAKLTLTGQKIEIQPDHSVKVPFLTEVK